jgi:hypothetical protein
MATRTGFTDMGGSVSWRGEAESDKKFNLISMDGRNLLDTEKKRIQY